MSSDTAVDRRPDVPDGRDASAPRVRYVCMPGSPYTGSTLLGFLLDAHPACVSIGAATGLTSKIDLRTYACSCGERFVDCPFWNRVAARTRELGAPVTVFETGYWNTHVTLSDRRWLDGLLVRSLGDLRVTAARDAVVWRAPAVRRTLARARNATWSLARAVLEETRASAFIDSARDHQRPKYLMRDPRLDVRVLHLVRDPRGNTASIMKHTGVDVMTAAKRWRHYNVEADRVRALLPEDAWLRVRYEDLCREPARTLGTIARFVGVETADVPDDLQATDHHIIGNSMRLRGIGEIREDRSWEAVLDRDDLRAIERIAGRASRDLGMEWP
jgi:hypothetical protein